MKKNKLTNLRKKIDQVDNQLVPLLAKRIEVVGEIKKFKEQNNLAIEDKQREEKVLKKARKKAKAFGLSLVFIECLFKLIIRESKLIQQQK